MPAEPKVAILVNIVAPYRIPLYRQIGRRFRTSVFVSGSERNRATWTGLTDQDAGFEVRRTAGLSIPFRVGRGAVYDEKFLHLPFGHLLDLARTRPDAILTTEMGLRTLLALLYGSVTRTPVWVWWGGTLHTERNVGRLRRLVRRVVTARAKRWISYGETSTEYLESIGVPRERILQIQNCVDESIYLAAGADGTTGAETDAGGGLAPARDASLADLADKPVPRLLYVGQMIRRKGVDRFLEAAARVQREDHAFSILLVGDGAEKGAFETLARELGLRDTRFVTGQPPAAMPAVYRQADCLVFPTCEDVWGLVVNEAMWSGLPVVASMYAGCARELLPPEQIFDPLDPEQFARVLEKAVTGELQPPDTRRLRRCAEVGDAIVADIERTLSRGAA